MQNKELSQDQLDSIVNGINAIINIPFLNEEQERVLIKLLLQIILDKVIKHM